MKTIKSKRVRVKFVPKPVFSTSLPSSADKRIRVKQNYSRAEIIGAYLDSLIA
jgi:hypothetical protein